MKSVNRRHLLQDKRTLLILHCKNNSYHVNSSLPIDFGILFFFKPIFVKQILLILDVESSGVGWSVILLLTIIIGKTKRHFVPLVIFLI